MLVLGIQIDSRHACRRHMRHRMPFSYSISHDDITGIGSKLKALSRRLTCKIPDIVTDHSMGLLREAMIEIFPFLTGIGLIMDNIEPGLFRIMPFCLCICYRQCNGCEQSSSHNSQNSSFHGLFFSVLILMKTNIMLS